MKSIFPDKSITACTDASLDRPELYSFIRDSKTPRNTWRGPWYLSPNGFLYGASAVLAVAFVVIAVCI